MDLDIELKIELIKKIKEKYDFFRQLPEELKNDKSLQLEVLLRYGDNGVFIDEIPNADKELIYLALIFDPTNIFYIENPTEEMCIKAVQSHMGFYILSKIPREWKTEKVCLEALYYSAKAHNYIKTDPRYLHKHILERLILDCIQTEKVCLIAVKIIPSCLQYIKAKNQTEEICIEAVSHNGYTLQYVQNQTYNICKAAVYNTAYAFKYVEDEFRTKELYELYVEKLDSALTDYDSINNMPNKIKHKLACKYPTWIKELKLPI